MRPLSEQIEFLCGTREPELMGKLSTHAPFCSAFIGFLSNVSDLLMRDPDAKAFPDVITFAFFCRMANLKRIAGDYGQNAANRLGRGVTFHIAPSNVPINFAYSLAAGLLSGNACAVRVSSTRFEQVRIVCRAMQTALDMPGGGDVRPYISVMRYSHDSEMTATLSAACDVRLIWGGDGTIDEIRKNPLPPRSFDVTFADRYSFLIINAEHIIGEQDLSGLARDFFNDTYLYDQNACSSPRLVIWLGEKQEINTAKTLFWGAVREYVAPRYTLQPVVAVDKLTAACRCGLELPGIKECRDEDLLIRRILLPTLNFETDITGHRCPGGFYLEYDAVSLQEVSVVVSRKFQTLSYCGISPSVLQNWVIDSGLTGIDRIVPVGKTADFALQWDGYDLILTLSRLVASK